MNELRELYQEMILDHSKSPRNFGKLEGAQKHAEGFNPLCGDRVTIYVNLDNGEIVDIMWEGSGCAICSASASMMTETVKNQTEEHVRQTFESFHELVAGEADFSDKLDELGKLAVFSGVREYPIRVKCASLPWHTLNAALKGEDQPVSTE